MWGIEIIKQSNRASRNLEWLNRTSSIHAALGWNIEYSTNSQLYYRCDFFFFFAFYNLIIRVQKFIS